MKGRVAYGQLNAAVQSINTTVTSKYKILHQPVKTLNNVSRTLQQRFKDQETKDTKGITILSVCLFQSCWSKAFLTSFSTAVHHVLTVLSYRELRVHCLLQKSINTTAAWTGISAPITKVIYPGSYGLMGWKRSSINSFCVLQVIFSSWSKTSESSLSWRLTNGLWACWTCYATASVWRKSEAAVSHALSCSKTQRRPHLHHIALNGVALH